VVSAERSRAISFDPEELLGFIAGALITFALVPQVWRLYSLKSAREISLPFSLMFFFGGIFWLSYGVAMDLFPVVLWNSIAVVLMASMIYAKFRYGR